MYLARPIVGPSSRVNSVDERMLFVNHNERNLAIYLSSSEVLPRHCTCDEWGSCQFLSLIRCAIIETSRKGI